ncbi:MAG: carboxylate--amine ligase [Gaiellaceae bacterium]
MSRAKVFVFKGVPSRFHHGALGIARTLGRLGVPVAANDETKGTAASRSRYRTESIVWSPWPTTGEDVVEKLVAWGRVQDQPALLMPVDDAATIVVEEHADDLAQYFRFARQPKGLVQNLSSKWTMAQLALEHGIATARVAKVDHLDDLDSLLGDFGLPVVIKRIEGWTSDSRSVPSVSVAHSRKQAREIVAQQPENFMLQEYIPGKSDTSWMFNGYFDTESRCLFGATGYKIRQYPLSGGFTTLGQLRAHDEIQSEIVRFLGAVGYRGIVDLGRRVDARDGSYKLLDVNPRVGSTFRLFVDSAGDDVVRVCYANLIEGNSAIRTAPVVDRRWSAELHDLRAGVGLVRAKKLGVSKLVRTTVSVDERAWWARDDPKPFMSAVLAETRITARAGLTSLRTLT